MDVTHDQSVLHQLGVVDKRLFFDQESKDLLVFWWKKQWSPFLCWRELFWKPMSGMPKTSNTFPSKSSHPRYHRQGGAYKKRFLETKSHFFCLDIVDVVVLDLYCLVIYHLKEQTKAFLVQLFFF